MVNDNYFHERNFENPTITNPNIFELEQLRTQLIEKSLTIHSSILRLFEYQNYFYKVHSYQNPNIIETFLSEFLEDYSLCISKFELFGVHPSFTDKLLDQIKTLCSFEFAGQYRESLIFELSRIEKLQNKLTLRLLGKAKDENKEGISKAYFPLIAKENHKEFYGILESVTIYIRKAEDADKFIIVPSEKEIEKKIFNQCKTSWQLALNLSRDYIHKHYKFHEVIISFDKKEGFYEGTSLGIALTLSFLEQLLKFYNPTYIIRIKEQTAFTGGLTEEGKVLSCGEEIIKQKVKAVFFSEINSFVVSKEDEIAARKQLLELQKEYPNRNLKLIPVEDIEDVLNRRDLVEIKKQKLVVPTGKFTRKNWVSAVITVLLAVLFGYLFVMDWDDNPAILENQGSVLLVKNKNGKTLWTKKIRQPIGNNVSPNIRRQHQKLVDSDGDGLNELLLCNELFSESNYGSEFSRIACYNFAGKIIWEYLFADTVYSNGEMLPPIYNVKMIDTITLNNNRQIICIANNESTYASAVFKLNIKNGVRTFGTLWNAGHIVEGISEELPLNKKKNLIFTFFNNSYHKIGIGIIPSNEIAGTTPCSDKYRLDGIQNAKSMEYMLVPRTDFNKYFMLSMNSPIEGILSIKQRENTIEWSTSEGKDIAIGGIVYGLRFNLRDLDIVIGSNFAAARDSLVIKRILNNPLTDTKEYRELLKSQTLYWNGAKFVTCKTIK